jgi:hypothetical protein
MTDGQKDEQEDEERRPHHFFWCYLAILGVGVLSGFLIHSHAAGWSLGSKFVDRVEVGLLIAGVLYLAVIGGWYAWDGFYLGNLRLPTGLGAGGGAQPVDPDQVAGTADEVEKLRKATEERFEALEETASDLASRVVQLEKPRK